MFLKIRKRSSLCGFDWEKIPEKGLRQWKRVFMSLTGICAFVCVREKKNSFEITVIILKYI